MASTMLDDARRSSSGSTSRADLMRRVAGGQEAVFGRVALSSQLLPKRLDDAVENQEIQPIQAGGFVARSFVIFSLSLSRSAFSPSAFSVKNIRM